MQSARFIYRYPTYVFPILLRKIAGAIKSGSLLCVQVGDFAFVRGHFAILPPPQGQESVIAFHSQSLPAKPLQFPLTKALTKLCVVPFDHMTNLASQPARNKENKDHKYASIDPPIPIQRLLAAFCGLRITFFRENQRRSRCWCRCWWWAQSRRKMMVNNFQSARQSCKRPNTNPLAPRTNQFAI